MNKITAHLQHENAAKLLIRLTLGTLLLMHGLAKIGNADSLGFIASQLTSFGLPNFLLYGVFIGELFAPLMLIIGFQSRIAGLLIAGNMLFAIGLVHMTEIFSINNTGGWALELQGFYLLSGLVIALLGSGRYAIQAD
ncbi:DoxX family protein [Marinomonas sp. PE14-40]|uniref:DoxX family protein n=1 Tax=Marinomonas sp. PE14-40 TaxID=3060621 RepID=UPI003F66441B